MARYEDEFVGIPAVFAEPSGADPNYVDGYHGMRMRGGHGRAAYGAYRLAHPDDVRGWGGYGGIHGEPRGNLYRGYDQGWERIGRVAPDYYDPDLLRDYNAMSSPPVPRRYDRDHDRLQEHGGSGRERWWTPDRGYRGGYANRGISDAGYSEAWARFPMRGGR